MIIGVGLMVLSGDRSWFHHSVAKAAQPSELMDPAEPDQLIVIPDVQRDPRATRFLSAFQLPDQLTFAGQPVPLDNWQVRERIEYEFYQFLADEGQSIILAKRTGRCFPPLERQLSAAGLPDDLKYFLLLESKCANTVSVPYSSSTLRGKRGRVKRLPRGKAHRPLESVEVTLQRVNAAKAKSRDWFLAMAVYAAGEDHIDHLVAVQKVRDYWKLADTRDTMRYVPRIIAAKEIYSHPEHYLGVSKQDLYAPLETEAITVQVREPMRHLSAVADDVGSYYLELKLLNPHITHDSLPRGTHILNVPKQAPSSSP
jgi:membrane-bound lytic murein transglycosylase D